MLEIILWSAIMVIAGIILMVVLNEKLKYLFPQEPGNKPNPPRGSGRMSGGTAGPKQSTEEAEANAELEVPGIQPPANRIVPVTLFTVLVRGSAPTLKRMVKDRIVKKTDGLWQETSVKEEAAVIIAVYVESFFGKDERMEFTYHGEIAGDSVFVKNTKNYKRVAYPNEAEIFKLAGEQIAGDILREHARYIVKKEESS